MRKILPVKIRVGKFGPKRGNSKTVETFSTNFAVSKKSSVALTYIMFSVNITYFCNLLQREGDIEVGNT